MYRDVSLAAYGNAWAPRIKHLAGSPTHDIVVGANVFQAASLGISVSFVELALNPSCES